MNKAQAVNNRPLKERLNIISAIAVKKSRLKRLVFVFDITKTKQKENRTKDKWEGSLVKPWSEITLSLSKRNVTVESPVPKIQLIIVLYKLLLKMFFEMNSIATMTKTYAPTFTKTFLRNSVSFFFTRLTDAMEIRIAINILSVICMVWTLKEGISPGFSQMPPYPTTNFCKGVSNKKQLLRMITEVRQYARTANLLFIGFVITTNAEKTANKDKTTSEYVNS